MLLAVGAVSLDQAKDGDRHARRFALLFAFMVLSAQLRLGGFYTRVVRAVTAFELTPEGLLAAILVTTGSAVRGVHQRRGLPGGGAAGDRSVRAAAAWRRCPFLLARGVRCVTSARQRP